jgi:hypothetical protein
MVLLDVLLDVVGEGLNVDTGAPGGDYEHVAEKERLFDVEQDNVGSVLGVKGIGCRPGQFDTVLYDVNSICLKALTISPQTDSA